MVTEIELFKLINAKALFLVIKRRNYILFINFHFNLMFKRHICYTEITDLLQFTTNVRKSQRKPECTL